MLHTFVQKANAKGMTVSLIYDDTAIATSNNNTTMTTIANKYLEYCATYPSDLMMGIHFDVEGVGRDVFVNNMVSQFAAARARGVYIAVDVNCGWKTGADNSLTYNGVTGVYNIIAANVDCLSLMAYRDTAEDIWSLGSTQLTAAKAKNTKIVFGVETGRFSFNEENVEFYQEGKEICYTELAKVFRWLAADHPSAGYGIAIHDVNWWYKLKNKQTDPNPA